MLKIMHSTCALLSVAFAFWPLSTAGQPTDVDLLFKQGLLELTQRQLLGLAPGTPPR